MYEYIINNYRLREYKVVLPCPTVAGIGDVLLTVLHSICISSWIWSAICVVWLFLPTFFASFILTTLVHFPSIAASAVDTWNRIVFWYYAAFILLAFCWLKLLERWSIPIFQRICFLYMIFKNRFWILWCKIALLVLAEILSRQMSGKGPFWGKISRSRSPMIISRHILQNMDMHQFVVPLVCGSIMIVPPLLC